MSNPTSELRESISEIVISHFSSASRQVMQEMLEEIEALINAEKQRLLAEMKIPEKYNGTIYGSEYETGRNDAIDEFTTALAVLKNKEGV